MHYVPLASLASVSLVVLLLHGAVLAAQTTPVPSDSAGIVMGTVRSWMGGTEIRHADVLLEPMRSGPPSNRVHAASDSLGRFVAKVPVSGSYLLRVRAIGSGGTAAGGIPIHVERGDTVRMDVFLPPPGYDPALQQAQIEELAEQNRRWSGHRVARYRGTVTWQCFCFGGGEWHVAVQPESTVVVKRPPGRNDEPPLQTVDALFAWLEAEIRDPSRQVKVLYDSTLGYPTDIFSDTRLGWTDMWTRVWFHGVVALPLTKPGGRSPPRHEP